MYPSLTAQSLNNAWKFICLCMGEIFPFNIGLILPLAFGPFSSPHLSRTCIHLLLAAEDFPSSVWVWLDTHFFHLNLLLRVHWTTVVVLSSTRGANIALQGNEGGWRASDQWKWERAVATGTAFTRDLLFSFWPRGWCTLQALVHPEHQIDWLLGDPPAFQHMEPAPFHLGGSLSFSVDEGRLWLQSQMSWRSSFLVCAELVWLIIFDTSQGRERYSGWESKNTFQVSFLFCILWIWWIFFPLSCHSLLINAFLPLNF